MSSGGAEYISAAVVYTRASHLRMPIHNLQNLGSHLYDRDIFDSEPARIFHDNDPAISWSNVIRI